MTSPVGRGLGVGILLVTAWACGGSTAASNDAGSDGARSSSSGGSGGGSSGGSSGGSGSSSGGRVPVNHRPSDAQCAMPAPAGDCTFNNPGAACHSDADCSDAGANGRCIVPNGPPTCFCTSDACTGDAQCKAGQACACHGSAYTGGAGNTCTPGNCRIDADCSSGSYCSPSAAPNTCGGLSGFYCHTSKDQCTDDADCTNSSPGTMCIYSPGDGFWSCQTSGLCAG